MFFLLYEWVRSFVRSGALLLYELGQAHL
jgi:hypothetical protein